MVAVAAGSGMAMWGSMVLLLLLINGAAGAITIQETLENQCTSDVVVQCKTLGKDYGVQTLTPTQSAVMSVTSTLEDPDLSCDFSSTVVPDLTVKKTLKVWEYLKSGFSDNPEMSCSNGCAWRAQNDGIYYRALDGSYVLFIKWAAIIPGAPVTGPP